MNELSPSIGSDESTEKVPADAVQPVVPSSALALSSELKPLLKLSPPPPPEPEPKSLSEPSID